MVMFNRNSPGFKKAVDRLAEWVIAAAGITVIAAMLAMLLLILLETAPLFLPARQAVVGHTTLPAGVTADDVLALGVEADLNERSRVAAVVLAAGRGGMAV
ncbi:MAG: hypothetical protein LIP77_05525, partial [Planctomycetes bacterium]|nr:hypothetical protein [Planctomycetota bacterium]